MTELNLEYLCLNVIDIARLAGNKILEIYNRGFDIEHKEDKTPLTTADLAAHDIILAGLKELTPEIPVLSEESEKIPFSIRQQWQRYWLVDPLDGTREFIKRNDEFSVNIALIENHQSILGVIYAPVMAIDYYAWRQGGAYKKEKGQQPQKIHVRSIDPTQLTVAGSRSHGTERQQEYIAKLGDVNLIPMGSSLKSCLVAEGKADIYPRLGPTSEWDTAAAQCIVEEAGGELINIETGLPMRYNTKDNLTNPHFLVYGDASMDWQALL
ncbi:MAG: 3'(2'),5'-bisphosphate nucleotidase [Gammaproteobacteria bacterium]|nr:MAG: 3'(2'),5'-bisphosphate nucleotidase [Gammaproteobacteria bacterium]